jgi:Ca2+-binding RTX toxin-like protein
MSVGLQGHVGQENDGWYGNPNDTGVNSVDISVDWVRVSQYAGNNPPPVTGGGGGGSGGGGQPPVVVPGLTLTGTAGADTLVGGTLADSLSGLDGRDRLSGGAGADSLSGGEGHDTLSGGSGADRLDGGAGNDALRGYGGDDVIVTGAGVDRVVIGRGEGADRVTDFAFGTDRVQLSGVTAEEVTAVAGSGGLVLTLPDGTTLTLEGVGAATARQLGISGVFKAGPTAPPAPAGQTVAGGAGDDTLRGGSGADTVTGGAGSDDLHGLEGADLLRGGRDHDGLTGGAGADTFAFARGDGPDWVVDFQVGVDKLRLEGITASGVTQTLETRWGMAGLELAFGNGDEVFLQGVTARIANSDMVFA